MPTVLFEKGYRFFFFSGDEHEPVHIHVEKDNKYAKFWLEPVRLARDKRFKAHELTEIKKIIMENQQLIRDKWNEHFNN